MSPAEIAASLTESLRVSITSQYSGPVFPFDFDGRVGMWGTQIKNEKEFPDVKYLPKRQALALKSRKLVIIVSLHGNALCMRTDLGREVAAVLEAR